MLGRYYFYNLTIIPPDKLIASIPYGLEQVVYVAPRPCMSRFSRLLHLEEYRYFQWPQKRAESLTEFRNHLLKLLAKPLVGWSVVGAPTTHSWARCRNGDDIKSEEVFAA